MESNDDPYERIARFYDLGTLGFDADFDLYEAFARRIDAPVLELGAGTGRVALELARRGLRVVGIDRSRAMLDIARRRAADEGIERVEFYRQNISHPSIQGSYGLIICAFDTFLHLSDTAEQIAALSAARERLAPGGLLAIDLPGPAGDWGDWDSGARPLVLDWSEQVGERRITRLSTFRADLAKQTRFMTDIYEEAGPDGTLRRNVIQYPLRFVFPAEMELLLRTAGLSLHACYGDYELGPFDAASERMIVLAQQAC